MIRSVIQTGVLVGLIGISNFLTVLHGEEGEISQSGDWPCQQAYVPEVPAAVVWAGPPISGMAEAWVKDEAVAGMVWRLTSPDYDMDNADREVADYVDKLGTAQKDHQLTLLFAGVIDTLNEKRRKELDGIIRYARGQAERANRLSAELDEMVELQDDPSQAARDRLALMQKEMEIKQRMFDEREDFIQYLCTRPMVIEEKLGALARTIAYYLD